MVVKYSDSLNTGAKLTLKNLLFNLYNTFLSKKSSK